MAEQIIPVELRLLAVAAPLSAKIAPPARFLYAKTVLQAMCGYRQLNILEAIVGSKGALWKKFIAHFINHSR